MKRILITGASGQIGTNLAARLKEMGYEVFGVDKRSNTWTDETPTLLQDLSSTYRNHLGGIGNVDYGQVDLVVHLAANAKVHELVEHPERAFDNFMMTFNVIEYCRQNNIPLVFSSTREVYGDIKRYETNEDMASFSTTESPYSASKISSEAFIYSYSRCYDMKYIVFRFSNVYGRYDNDIERMERVIPLFYKKIKDGEPITVYGRDKILDFTYIDDCVDGISRGVERLLKGQVYNQTFNLAYGQGNPLYTVSDVFQEVLDVKANVTFEPARVGEVTHYVADISNAKTLLGYHPKTDLKKGLRAAAEWYSANFDRSL
ncbi:MAG: NAD-dependent epimerase/dehydratase family protein [Lentisphaerales bacterium]|nr:NAD-dependent epimerase/dehydratase family protein [Lentisphaerales bacterium]